MPKKGFLNNLIGTSWTGEDIRRRDNEQRQRNRSGDSRPPREPKESKWREKSCPGYDGYCGTTIRYNIDWDNIPQYCPSCTQKQKKANRPARDPQPRREQRESPWREKPCPGVPGHECYNTIRYRSDWSNIPTHCNTCRDREIEKPCGTPGCTSTVRYKLHYREIPSYCGYCRKMMELKATRATCCDCRGVLWIPPGKNFKRCKNCSEANKRTKPCKNPLCSNVIEYFPDDEKQYDYCRTCSGWHEKQCGVATCNNVIRYKGFWTNIPSFCEEHLREMQRRQHPKYDEATSRDYPSVHAQLPGSRSSASDMGGDKAVVLGFADGHKHVSVFHGRKGEPGSWRYSWNVDRSGNYQRGSAHFTDDGSGLVRGRFSDESRWFNG